MNQNRKSPAEVVAYLLARPNGARTVEIAAELGLTEWWCRELLRRWKEEGFIRYVGHQPAGRWTHPDHAEQLAVKIAAEVKARKKAHFEAYRYRQKNGIVLPKKEKPTLEIKRVIVPVGKAKPIQKLGPNSVFELAR